MKISAADQQQKISLGILGMGAIGRLMAWHCHSAVHCYALQKQQSEPCSFQLNWDNHQHRVTIPAWDGTHLDVLLVCVKAQQTLTALEQWQHCIAPTTQIVLLQNGLGQQQSVANLHPDITVFAASTTEGANSGPNDVVNYAGQGETLWGHFSGPQAAFALPLNKITGNHKQVEDIQQVLLDKLAINAVINPLTVKYNCRNGQLIEQHNAHKELQQLALETEHIITRAGLRLSYPLLPRAEQVCSNTASNVSSMLADVRAHRKTEIDYINGYISRLAKENDTASDLNNALLSFVREPVHSLK